MCGSLYISTWGNGRIFVSGLGWDGGFYKFNQIDIFMPFMIHF